MQNHTHICCCKKKKLYKVVKYVMDCENVRNYIAEYIGQALDVKTKEEIGHHLDKCSSCFNEIKKLDSVTWKLECDSRSIKAPADFLQGIEEKAVGGIKPHIRIPVWFIKTAITAAIAAALAAVLVAAFILFIPQNFKYMIYNSVTFGKVYSTSDGTFGRRLNISSTSKNIKVTAVKVSADDMATIIYFKADLPAGQSIGAIEGVNVQEKQQAAGENIVQVQSLAAIFKSTSGGFALYLKPIAMKKQVLYILLSGIDLYNEDPAKNIMGTWSFKIPVEKLKSITYNINNNFTVDGYSISFKKLTAGPTGTYLSYQILNSDTKNTFTGLYNWYISYGKKVCKPTDYTNGEENSLIDRFESIYPVKPEKISINIKSVMEDINNREEKIKITVPFSGPFPREFNYNGNTIRIDNFIDNGGSIQFDLIEPGGQRNYTFLQYNITDSDNNVIEYETKFEKCYVIDKDNAEYDYENVSKDPLKYADKYLQTYPLDTRISFKIQSKDSKYFNIIIEGAENIRRVNKTIKIK